MKTNRIERRGKNPLALLVAGIIVAALAVALAAAGFGKLRALYLEQCVVTDLSRQVSVTSGTMVKADVIQDVLGLRAGANLATIDFVAKRRELLERIPNLLSVRITRQLPDRVTVVTEERTPVARIGATGSRANLGRVADAEGVVFCWQRGTQTLPVVRVAEPSAVAPGNRISGRALAALRLVEACQDPKLSELGILEVDSTPHDYLLATLGNYSKLKIAWEGMDEPSPAAQAALMRCLGNLHDAMRSKVVPGVVIWNATIEGRIFADTQEKL